MKIGTYTSLSLDMCRNLFPKNNTDYVLAKKKAAIDFTVRRGQT